MRKIALIVGIIAVIGIGAFAFIYLPSRSGKEGPGLQGLQAAGSVTAPKFYALELNGANMGYLQSASGGTAVVDVLSNGTDKNLGSVKYEEVAVAAASFSLNRPLFDWIGETWTGKVSSKNGAVFGLDQSFNVQSRREFTNALLTEATFPTLGLGATAPGLINFKFLAERTNVGPAGGAVGSSQQHTAQMDSNRWTNFRLTVDGLDASGVKRIESFSVKQKVETGAKGATSAGSEFPNLKIAIAEGTASQGWSGWLDDFVINGKNQEKNGKITFIGRQGEELASIQLLNMGIYGIYPDPNQGEDPNARVVAELYVERMEFNFTGK